MFENLYTTKMSGNTKMLQKRFTKIRSHQSRKSKIMAAVVAMTLAVTALCATVALAAVGSDGLEYWDRNEIYFCDSIKFSVNVAGKNVPQYVFEDIAGEDGNIDIAIKKYQIRRISGAVANQYTADFSGSKGTISLASSHSRHYGLSEKENIYVATMRFIDFTQDGGFAEYLSPFSKILTPDKGKRRYIEITFTGDENINIDNISVKFACADESSAFDVGNPNFDNVKLSSLINVIGSAENFFHQSWNQFFTDFERNYKNRDVEGIDIRIEKAEMDAIVIKADIKLADQWNTIVYEVYDKNEKYLATDDEYVSDNMIVLSAVKPYNNSENCFKKGETYRVCVGINNRDHNLIYRWNEYVTIK